MLQWFQNFFKIFKSTHQSILIKKSNKNIAVLKESRISLVQLKTKISHSYVHYVHSNYFMNRVTAYLLRLLIELLRSYIFQNGTGPVFVVEDETGSAVIVENGTDSALVLEDGTGSAFVIENGTDSALVLEDGTGSALVGEYRTGSALVVEDGTWRLY